VGERGRGSGGHGGCQGTARELIDEDESGGGSALGGRGGWDWAVRWLLPRPTGQSAERAPRQGGAEGAGRCRNGQSGGGSGGGSAAAVTRRLRREGGGADGVASVCRSPVPQQRQEEDVAVAARRAPVCARCRANRRSSRPPSQPPPPLTVASPPHGAAARRWRQRRYRCRDHGSPGGENATCRRRTCRRTSLLPPPVAGCALCRPMAPAARPPRVSTLWPCTPPPLSFSVARLLPIHHAQRAVP